MTSLMINKMRKFFGREEGATMVEYGLMVALIAVAAIVAVTLVGTNVGTLFTSVAGDLTGP